MPLQNRAQPRAHLCSGSQVRMRCPGPLFTITYPHSTTCSSTYDGCMSLVETVPLLAQYEVSANSVYHPDRLTHKLRLLTVLGLRGSPLSTLLPASHPERRHH